MFESLKKAIDEIFGSVIRPIKEWILRQSWGVQFVLLIVIAAGAFAWWKPHTAGGLYQQGAFYWRSWHSESDKIPLSTTSQRALALAVNRLAPTVEADIDGQDDNPASPLTPWSASQSVLALRLAGRTVPDRNSYVTFVKQSRLAPDCFCWTEIAGRPRTDVMGHISGWVMAAFAEVREPLAPAELDYVLNHQNGGWWPMFPESGAAKYPSTYTTAWMAFGLYKQRTAGLVSADKAPAVDRAIRRAAMWLMRSREGARWKAHHGIADTDSGEALAGFVLYVLHQVGTKDLADVDRAWLDSIPDNELGPTSRDDRTVILPYSRHDSGIDAVSEVRLPWILLGTANAYSSGTVAQKARALKWFEKVLRDPSVRNADTQGFDWVRAELLIGITETGKLIDCTACTKGGHRVR